MITNTGLPILLSAAFQGAAVQTVSVALYSSAETTGSGEYGTITKITNSMETTLSWDTEEQAIVSPVLPLTATASGVALGVVVEYGATLLAVTPFEPQAVVAGDVVETQYVLAGRSE